LACAFRSPLKTADTEIRQNKRRIHSDSEEYPHQLRFSVFFAGRGRLNKTRLSAQQDSDALRIQVRKSFPAVANRDCFPGRFIIESGAVVVALRSVLRSVRVIKSRWALAAVASASGRSRLRSGVSG
jgi:hypothetical protein